MPRLSEIEAEDYEFLRLGAVPWFPEAASHNGLARGGIYLLSGAPGAGKTTLALQFATDLACQGHRVLYLALEQSPSDIKHKITQQVFPHRRASVHQVAAEKLEWKQGLKKAKKATEVSVDEDRIEDYFWIDYGVSGMEALPDFLARQVLGQRAQYSGTRFIVVDSIQGLGTAPTSSRPYQRLFEFNRYAKDSGITVLLVGHITKGGAIAGPRSLEHNVDCVLYMRKAMRLRPLFVPKNRFGAERYEPMSLVMDKWGCLEKSKHVRPRASQAFGFLPGSPDLIEVQALVKLPKYGDKPGIKAPYLPRQKLTQLVGIISSLKDIDISDLTFEINCSIPGGRPYYQTLDLPLSVSMLSSYFQSAIPPGSLFVGEVDLFQDIRPVPAPMSQQIVELLRENASAPGATRIERLYVSDGNVDAFASELAAQGSRVRVHGVSNLDALVRSLWPDVIDTV